MHLIDTASMFDVSVESVDKLKSCSFKDSWSSPMYDPYQNSLNPCFLAAVVTAVSVFFMLPVCSQLFKRVWFNSFGPYPIKYAFGSTFNVKSVGIFNLIKFNSVFIQCLLTLVLTTFEWGSGGLTFYSLLAKLVTICVFVTPLHLVEPTSSAAASTSLLFYWLVDVLCNLVVLLQDCLSSHKVYIPQASYSIQSAILMVEVLLFLNSAVVFVLEAFLYRPSVELVEYFELNGWDIRRERTVFNRLFFSYLHDTIKTAQKTEHIDVDELPPFVIDVDNEVAYNSFLKYWDASVKRADKMNKVKFEKCKKSGKPFVQKQPSLFIPLFLLTQKFFMGSLFFNLLELFAGITQPYLLRRFLLFATNRYTLSVQDNEDIKQEPIIIGLAVATGIYILAVVNYISFNRRFVNTQCMGDSINTALSTHIYNKGMKLSPKARKSKSVGEIINNMAQDVSTLRISPNVIADIVVQPLRLFVYMFTLYNFLGVASIAGLLTAVVLIPFASASFTIVIKEIKRASKFKDKRAKLTSEILTSIKSIKLYSWEESMLVKLFHQRNDLELNSMKKIGVIRSFINLIWALIPVSIAISTFTCAAILSEVTLTPDLVFPALTIFDLLGGPILQMPNIFTTIAQSKVAIDRLAKLFVMQELDVVGYERINEPVQKGDVSVSIKDATFVWDSSTEEEIAAEELSKVAKTGDEEASVESTINNIALQDINYQVRKGELSCVVGKVGSGKTTFLKAILGCIPLQVNGSNSSLKVNGSLAYCSQSAWILNASVRANIIFGRKYDPIFYKTVVAACELTKDFEVLPDGDRTIVGEKGISLSGGQKARISLARAVYSKADVYVLDDVLSAVDTHVGKNIIKHVLGTQGLLASKTTILATNSVPVLHEAGDIVLLSGGKIVEHGSFDEVMATGSELAKLIEEFGKKEEEETEEVEEIDKPEESQIVNTTTSSTSENEISEFKPDIEDDLALQKVDSNVTVAPSFVSFGHNYQDDFDDDPDTVKRTGDTEEIQGKGRVNLSIYFNYAKACGYWTIGLYLLIICLTSVSAIVNTIVLKHWSEDNAKEGENSNITYYLMLYSGIGALGPLLTFSSSLVLFTMVAIKGGKHYHDTMARNVLRSPMSFFETTPVGRILNRLTEDINVVDNQLMWVLGFFPMCTFRAILVFSIVIVNLPFMFVVIVSLLYFYDKFRRSFIPASREFKRVRSARKSPVFSHLQESITGAETLIAYDQVDRFQHKSSENLNKFMVVEQSNLACDRWLSMRLQGLSAVVVYCSSLLIIASLVSQHPLGPGLVGFLMTYILDVTATLNAIVRGYAEVENRSVTLERLLEYCNLTPEAPMIIEDNRPADAWPEKGAVSFKKYETKYRANLDPVLKDLNIDIKPAEKVGIVGRTGAGKSTLTLALFRILEASGGCVEIDGVDTSKLGLFDLRSKLNIIPQDSQAINGSIRENLDPLGKYTDEELWRVLELSHLKEHVQEMKTEHKKDDGVEESVTTYATGLDAIVEEGGSNLSAGQKQLMCLARALLNPSKILILDEATASVDVRTDKIVQDTIRSQFKDKTILTIAHRIETIMDSDRILVLERGEVKEFDAPSELLKNPDGIFYSLCKQGGHM